MPRAMQVLSRRIRDLVRVVPERESKRETYLAVAELLRRDAFEGAPSSLDLGPYELRVFSQNGEDGALAEILRRIGTGSQTFVEFGTESGIQANCIYLADVCGWRGHFFEGSPVSFSRLARKYELNDKVVTANVVITPNGIETTFGKVGVPADLDVLSIDVDSHDYWIWQALTSWRPRVVVIEYNGALGLELRVQSLEYTAGWQGTDYYGASIAALRRLGTEKGYRLVHTDLSGSNAFFVRDDLHGDFLTADEVTLRAPNFDLAGRHHPPGEGPYTTV